MEAVRASASQLSSTSESVSELKKQLVGDPVAVLAFHSTAHEAQHVAELLASAFPGARTLGCSTMGELGGGRLFRGGISAIALYAPVRLAVQLVEDTALFQFSDGETRVRSLAAELGLSLDELEDSGSVLITLTDGLSMAEERLVASVALAAPGLPLVGGSVADDLKMAGTTVFLDGRVSPSSSLLLLLQPRVPHRVFAVHHFEPTPRRVVVTRSEPDRRILHELDGWPAATVYAELAGLELAELEADPLLPSRREVCFGIRVGQEYRMRSPFSAMPDGSLALRGGVEPGEVLRVMRGRDLVDRTRVGLEQALAGLDACGLILFNCGGRLLEAEAHGQLEQLGEAMAPVPSAGFSTYGEQYGPLLVNHTLTGVAFGG